MNLLVLCLSLLFAPTANSWIPATTLSPRFVQRSAALYECAASASKQDKYLLDRIGGEPALNATIDEFYNRLVADESLMKYFDGVPVERVKEHQFNFMRVAFTAIPEELDVAKMLTDGHSRLWSMGLDENDFDTVAGHLVGTLESLGLAQPEIDEVVGVVGPLRAIFEHKEE